MSDSMNAIDVTFRTEVSIENKSTEQLAAEVNVRYRQAEGLANMSAMMLADAGRRLIEIKGRIPHGQFESWCAENLEFSKSKAEKMMKLAERVDDDNSLFSKTETFTDIGISRIWALLAAPEEVAAEVIETHDVSDMTVRELKEEIARLKEEKAAAERKADTLDHNNDDIRKEVSRLQGKLAESVTQEEFDQMQEVAQAKLQGLTEELNEARAASAEVQAKLDKAKEDLKKQKAKQKELEAAKDEEVQKGIEEAKADIEKKAKEEGAADAAAALAKNAEDIEILQAEIEKLEAEKAKLSNTALMEFKVYVDQLQDIYDKLNDMITEESLNDEELGTKMKTALQMVIGRWNP